MKKSCILALVAAATAMPQLMINEQLNLAQEHGDLFVQWRKKFGKKYSAEEESAKQAVWKDNLDTITAHNAQFDKGLMTYKMGLNQFSDLSADEFKDIYLSEHKVTRPRKETYLDASANPASMDWRTKGAVTAVKNQGQCGSCWSFSTTGSTEGRWQIAGGKLTSLSEQQLMDCSTAEGDHSCQGGLMDYGFTYITKNGGITTEADYPYKEVNEACDTAKEKNVAARVSSYHDVPQGDEAQLEAAIASGPVSVAIEADQSGFQHYQSGTFTGPCGTKLDHGVLAVGYSADYWIVKNSWGETWGDAGYIKLSRAGNLCGILNSASYPVANAGPLPPSPPPSPAAPTPAPGKWTSVAQTVYKGPQKCNSANPQATNIPLDTCTPDGDGAFKMSCSSDGTQFTQTQYTDAACTAVKGAVPGATNQCLSAGVLTYVEFACQTATSMYEIASN